MKIDNLNYQKYLLSAIIIILIIGLGACSDFASDSPAENEIVEKFEVLVFEPGVNLEEGSNYYIMEEATVKLGEQETETDSNGVASFDNLESGKHKLEVQKEGYSELKEEIYVGPEELSLKANILQEDSAEIEPETVDYNLQDPQDVETSINWNEAGELEGVYRKLSDGDYEVNEKDELDHLDEQYFELQSDKLVISQSYIEKFTDEDNLELFLNFTQGSDKLFKINIVDEEVKTDAEINPTEFDFFLNDPANIEADITWNDATEITDINLELSEDNYDLKEDVSISNDEDKLIIDSESILEEEPQDGDKINIEVSFDSGEPVDLTVNVKEEETSEPEPEPGEIAISGNLSLTHNFPGSVVEEGTEAVGDGELWESQEMDTQEKEDGSQEMILEFDNDLNKEEIEQKIEEKGYKMLDYMEELKSALVEIPEDTMFQTAEEDLESDSEILSTSENKVFSIFDYKEPNDEYYNKQWAPSVMRLPQSWRDSRGSSNVRMAVLDTGINDNNFELSDFIDTDSGYNFVDENDDFFDGHGHGTHVSGIIGAKGNNEKGVAGVMWDSELIPVKVLSDSGSGSEWSVAQGILYAAGLLEEQPIEKADVINMSLGIHSEEVPELMEDAVQKATEAGVVIVAAAGNSGTEEVGYPAKFEEVIAVGSVSYREDEAPELASYSSYGPEVDLVAPGTDIWSTIDDHHITDMSGTSMASPQIAGVAGLLISEGTPHNEVLPRMKKTAIDLGDEGFDNKYGYGMINTYWSVHNSDEINIMVGKRDGQEFTPVAETTTSIEENEYVLEDVPEGEYEVMAWIDVRGSGNLENGDYFATTETVQLEDGENYTFDLELKEFH
ncbi:MAG: S8 family peptidase [bacterium]